MLSMRLPSRFLASLASFASFLAYVACLACLAWLGEASAQLRTPSGLQPVPALTTRVTDTTGTLSAEQISQLTAQLKAIEDRKGSQVAVLIVATTQPEDISEYALRVAETWKLGRGVVNGKMVADGVLVLVAKDDRKLRIEVGRGLEGAIPDSRAKRIITETISPRFRSGDFAGGLAAGISDIGKLIEGEALPEPWRGGLNDGGLPDPRDSGGGLGDLIPILIGIGIMGIVLTSLFGRFFGGSLTGLAAGFMSLGAGTALPIAAAIGIGAALLFMIFGGTRRRVHRVGRHTYGHAPIIIPGGGWGGSGGFGGFGGGDSGFFGGGGDFGGGGASGDW